ncbi:MAG TPA: hypothetical protein VJK53_01805 [Candidatus Paceibacterota bacterium]
MGEIGKALLDLRTSLAKVLQEEEGASMHIPPSRIGGDFTLRTELRQAAARKTAIEGGWKLRDCFKSTVEEMNIPPNMTVDDFVTSFQTY